MATIQSAINNILGDVARGVATAKHVKAQKEKAEAAKYAEEQEKLQAAKAEEIKAKEAEEATQKDIKATESKLNEALSIALGYTQKQARGFEAAEAMGDLLGTKYEKKPRGVGQKTFERRKANAISFQKIQSSYIQQQEFRDRLRKFSAKEVAEAIKPEIDKKGGKK